MLPSKILYDKFLEFFDIEEIVSPLCYNTYKHKGPYFFLSHFDPRLLQTMLVIRTLIGKPITINNWKWGGNFDERGLRDNLTDLVKKQKSVYLSGHVLAMAFDFDVEGMTAEEVRQWLQDNAHILPYRIRLEHKIKGKPITWVHLDVKDEPKNPKVYLFNI